MDSHEVTAGSARRSRPAPHIVPTPQPELGSLEVVAGFAHGAHKDDAHHRDAKLSDPHVKDLVAGLGLEKGDGPKTVDLREHASAVRFQGQRNACTAFSTCALLELVENQAMGTDATALSRRFLYKASRTALQWEGDVGSHLRATIGTLATVGVVPERWWPWDEAAFDDEPSGFCWAMAGQHRIDAAVRLDHPDTESDELIQLAKSVVASRMPLVGAITLYEDAVRQSVKNGGAIPLPRAVDKAVGGHAIVIVGYDDSRVIANISEGGMQTTGAFLIQNSWSDKWGDKGFGWVPYDYVTVGQWVDWWLLLREHWVDTVRFGF